MSRKPSRDRQDVENGLDDLLGNVLSQDRARGGRPDPVPADEPPTQPDTNALVSGQNADEPEAQTPVESAADNGTPAPDGDVIESDMPARKPILRLPDESDELTRRTRLLAERTERAKDAAQSLTATVTLRIPHEMNDYLDEYVHGAWSRENRIRKQQMVIEALQMLMARRGRAGEEILPTDLLPLE